MSDAPNCTGNPKDATPGPDNTGAWGVEDGRTLSEAVREMAEVAKNSTGGAEATGNDDKGPGKCGPRFVVDPGACCDCLAEVARVLREAVKAMRKDGMSKTARLQHAAAIEANCLTLDMMRSFMSSKPVREALG